MAEHLIDVALFPIPAVVAFPGTVVPLHVFEPRYRQMVRDAVDQDRMIAICHTRKEIHPARQGQSVQDALKNNQATYEPYDVFSAGTCHIVDTTDDGRIFINIVMRKRLKRVTEIQTLPYRIVSCRELKDDTGQEDVELLRDRQTSITEAIFTLISKHNPGKLQEFRPERWLALDPVDFSFQVFQLVKFEPDLMQSILETDSALERLKIVDSLLKFPPGR